MRAELPTLGATWDGRGVSFAVASEYATGIDLCLFSQHAVSEEYARIPLLPVNAGVWHTRVPDLMPGQLYGYRASGPYEPERGYRFNPHKLLIDPYARAIGGGVRWDDAVFGYRYGDPREDMSFDARDSAAFVPKSIVIDPAFDWENDHAPRIPWQDTLIYECHLKGMTALHPDVPPHLRGTYLGLASPPVIDHLKRLGVTAVELMPLHHCVHRRALIEQGLSNYWGYDSIGFFAPDSRFATGMFGEQVLEFKAMVKALHRAGLEVILDVVYNHTAEGDRLGPTLSLRGLDNSAYYRLEPHDPRSYTNLTGCGNTLNTTHPRAWQLVLDSLHYWVQEMHVDGFRFDLASVHARDRHGVAGDDSFLVAVRQDPILAQVKLIAEPWDLGRDGYRLGAFPPGWAEWNDKYRDCVRRFWRGDRGQVPELAARLNGSRDIFPRRVDFCTSINCVTSHDGFTLHDLVSYERKHNGANQEENRDGPDHNFSRNWGIEGATDLPQVLQLRSRLQRSVLATLAFSLGIPMICAGDEMDRTQLGNNNAYCQDNEISWLRWNRDGAAAQLTFFTAELFGLRRLFMSSIGESLFREEPGKLTWLREDGGEMMPHDWHDSDRHTLGMLVNGLIPGRPATPSLLLLVLHGGDRRCIFRLPSIPDGAQWLRAIDTAFPHREPKIVRRKSLSVLAHSLVFLKSPC